MNFKKKFKHVKRREQDIMFLFLKLYFVCYLSYRLKIHPYFNIFKVQSLILIIVIFNLNITKTELKPYY